MVDLKELAQRGVSSGAFKEIFTARKKAPRVQKLIDTISQRVSSGREANLNSYRLYWAIDLAHETDFAQTTPTLVQNLLSKNLDAKGVLEQLEVWGLSEKELFLSVEQPNGDVKKVLNPPVFYQILIPVVRAYHTAKTAKIYNERDTSPLFKYKPAKNTDANRVACEIWTDIVDNTTQWYGHHEYLKQFISQMLKYGLCIMFPMEEWHCEKQIINGKKKVQKEGLRYNLPHPTKMGYDMSHPAPTINTDSGCEYAWHWDVKRYGDILDNRLLWNREQITFGTNWMDKPLYRNYFNEVFPCKMRFPTPGDATMKRDEKAAYYGTAERDAAIFQTEFFWKLIPSNWGLGNYKYPVWHRFTVASDDTILWAAPCAYNPLIFAGYDFDAQAGTPSSFSLETIPWQDHLGNILSQMILTAKQNLENVIFYDTLLVNPKDIKAMENLGERRYRSRNFLAYDSRKLAQAGLNVKEAFFSPQFQYRSIVELQSMLSTALNIMERVLQITAQETGSAAQHYQSKEEIVTVRNSGDTRLRFTASSVDSGRDAWMQQLVEANRAYRDDKVTAQVSDTTPGLEKILADMGFKITGAGPYRKLVIGRHSDLPFVSFARTNLDPSDNQDPQTVAALMQGLQVLAANQEFTAKVGVPRLLKMLEQVIRLSGGPSDFDLTSPSESGAGVPNELLQQIAPLLQQLQQTILQTVTEKVAAPAAQQMAQMEQQVKSLGAVVQKLEGQFQANGIEAEKLRMAQAELNQKLQLREAEFQAEQSRAQMEHELDLNIKAAEAGLDSKIKIEKATVDTAVKQEQSVVDAEVKKKKAASTKKPPV